MKKILAVSGGVDSMVLFEMMVRGELGGSKDEIIVAHFDHGTRESSRADAEFVRRRCTEEGVECVVRRVRLGEGASEAEARAERYAFLEEVARTRGGEIFTAHHMDDMLESVAINMLRGTGWRGLAPMGNEQIRRPLLERKWGRKEILRYAGEREIRFRQDPTNHEDYYLRNRVREALRGANEVEKLAEICRRQGEIRREIEGILEEILPEDGVYRREWFLEMPDEVAREILRAGLERAGVKMTRPQLEDFLWAVREYAPGKKFNLPGGKMVEMRKGWFKLGFMV